VALHAEIGYALAETQLDFELAILIGRPQSQSLARHGAQKKSLRQMWALIWKLWLSSYEHDLTGETGVPQASGDGVPSGAAAHDQRFCESSRTRSSDHTRYPPRTAVANAYAVTR